MKKYKLLLALTATATALTPLVSCNKPKTAVTVQLIDDNEKETVWATAKFSFVLSDAVSEDKIKFKTRTIAEPLGGEPTKTIDVQGKYLDFIILFKTDEPTKYVFDLDWVIDGVTTSFKNLSLKFNPDIHILPTSALIINDGVLEGLRPDFTVTSNYDTLEIPDVVTSIKEGAFKDAFCTDSNKNQTINTIKLNSGLTNIGANAFDGCNSITTLDVSRIPVSTTECPLTIGKDAFANWKAIPLGIKYLAGSTSYDLLDYQLCDQGLSVEWFDTTVKRTMQKSEFDISNETTLNGFTWKTLDATPRHVQYLVNEFKLPENIETISANAFYDETNSKSLILDKFTSAELPSTLKVIGDNAFRDAPLTTTDPEQAGNLKLPETLTIIGQYAFSNTKFTSVKFGENIEWIGDYAFYNCSQLASIDVTDVGLVPDDWSWIGTFYGCAENGAIINVASAIKQWTEYFSVFGLGSWSFVDKVVVNKTSGYKPAVKPIEGWEVTKEVATTALKVALSFETIMIDEFAYTIADNIVSAGGLNKDLNLWFITADYTSDTINLTIQFETQNSGDITYKGNLSIINLSLASLSDVVVENKVMKFTFDNIFTNGTIIYLTEKEGSTEEVTHAITGPEKLIDANLGYVLSQLNIFDTEHKTLTIRSHYLGNFTIKE